MHRESFLRNLPSRLEAAADTLDDLANGTWVTSDADRDRLFALEAQIWRIAQTTRKAATRKAATRIAATREAATQEATRNATDCSEGLLGFLDRSLHAARSNLRLLQKLSVCEDDGERILEDLAGHLDRVLAELEAFAASEEAVRQLSFGVGAVAAVGGRS